MARTLSARALECIRTGPTVTDRCVITQPGFDPVVVEVSPGWSVSEKSTVAGTRLSVSSITFLPSTTDRQLIGDLFGLVGYPGAVFDIFVGINLGASIEWIPAFSGRVVDGSSRRNSLGVTAALSDHWSYYDRIPLAAPFTAAGDTRANLIAELFLSIGLGVSVVVEEDADGGTISAAQAAIYTGSRSQAASQLATDGHLLVGFDGEGDLTIKAQPSLAGTITADWQFRGGEGGTIAFGTLERKRPFAEALINGVRVTPKGEFQTWDAQTAILDNTDDPRHASRVGSRIIEVQSATLTTACDALDLALAELTRRLRGTDEKVQLTTAINPAVEADDYIYVAAGPTIEDPGWAGNYIATSVTHAPSAGTTTIEAVSATGYDLGIGS